MNKVESKRGLTYKLNDVWVDVLTEYDERMLEIIRKSFFRCFYSGKIDFDKSPIIEMVNQYLENNKDIDSEKYFKKRSFNDNSNYTYNIVDDEIHSWIGSKKYELIEYLF